MKGKHLSLKQRLLVAATLFGMFFGAGNLIFPVHLGQLAGHNLVPATVGFILTAVAFRFLALPPSETRTLTVCRHWPPKLAGATAAILPACST